MKRIGRCGSVGGEIVLVGVVGVGERTFPTDFECTTEDVFVIPR